MYKLIVLPVVLAALLQETGLSLASVSTQPVVSENAVASEPLMSMSAIALSFVRSPWRVDTQYAMPSKTVKQSQPDHAKTSKTVI